MSDGSRLATALSGRYRIERELGEGGMATVYLARDLKHDRDVAIKVLKPELAAVLGAERFVQEIATTAQLQHPNILPLFDSGEVDGFLYYVMPYVEGESLRDRLDRERQLGVDEAVKLVVEVADALQYAHEQGIVHRDIKPENILLHAGRPVVADFGIALAVSAAAGGRMTETGLSLGTPHYMSPEQATAEKEITGKSDIYSLASVLYEMLAGDPPHTGKSAQQIIVKIIADEVRPITELRKSVPPNVAAAIGKALEKLPADRFGSATAFADALRDPNFTGPLVPGLAEARRSTAVRFTHPVVLGLSGAVLILAALALWGWLRPAPSGPVTRFSIALTARGTAPGAALRVTAAISPDGSAIVYRDTLGGQSPLFLKRRAELEPHPLAGTEGARDPFFSPDGAWIGFFQRGELLKVPTTGGPPEPVADSAYAQNPVSGAWLDDGTIVFTDVSFRLRQVSANGGASRMVAERPASWPVSTFLAPLPGARGVLFTACTPFCTRSAEYVWDARRDSVRLLIDNGLGALYASTGQILFMTPKGTLLAAPWDNEALRITGPAVPVLEGVQWPGFLLSRSGTALYSVGSPTAGTSGAPDAEAVWVDRHGRVEPVDTTWRFSTGRRASVELSLAPDGKRLAIQLWTDLGYDVWIKPLPAGPATPLTFYPGSDGGPRWTPDGRTVTFRSNRPVPGSPVGPRYTLWSRASDGSGEATLLWRGRQDIERGIWSSDERWLILQTGPGNLDILAVRPGIDSVARPLEATRYEESAPALSPDGRWLAYVSGETGTNEVYVSPFPDTQGAKWQISTVGGSAPLWAHHGHELFYVEGDKLMSVQVDPGPPFSVGKRRVLFERPKGVRAWRTQGTLASFMDISPDDQRFIMVRDVRDVRSAAKSTPPKLVLVENFLEELRAKLKKKRGS